MQIPKKQSVTENYLLNIYSFESARAAFRNILSRFPDKEVIIPAYIGYSTREGSGVFDPVAESKNKFSFYHLKKDLTIDKTHISKVLIDHPNSILLIIHYFGFIQEDIDQIRETARSSNSIIVEDYAHSFFTFFRNPAISFDYAIFSLHKQFPFEKGGLLLSKNDLNIKSDDKYPYWKYNLNEISGRRIENYMFLKEQFETMPEVSSLHQGLPENIIPQTYPILLRNNSTKETIYFGLNSMGLGVVSLYHTLIDAITDQYIVERNISSRILNLPVHQDIGIDSLAYLVSSLKDMLLHV